MRPGIVRDRHQGLCVVTINGADDGYAVEQIGTVFGGEFRVIRQRDLRHRSAVIDPFNAVHERAAFQCDHILIVRDSIVTGDTADRHGQLENDAIARGPGSRQANVACRIDIGHCGLAVDADLDAAGWRERTGNRYP